MNLSTLIVLAIIIMIAGRVLYGRWKQMKSGQTACTACTVIDCPLANHNRSTLKATIDCPCSTVSDEERQVVLAQVKVARQQRSVRTLNTERF